MRENTKKRGILTTQFNLPNECIEFLNSQKNKVIDLRNSPAEIEKILFYSEEELTCGHQVIDTYEYFLNYNEFKEDSEIQYHIPCVNLIKEDDDDNYDADGLLVWLPDLNCFGSFDIDHCIGYLFQQNSWIDIESNLGKFINTQWYPEKMENTFFKPWKNQGLNVDFNQFIKE